MPEREEESIVGDLLSRAGSQQVVDAINKLEQSIRTIGSYLFADNEEPAGAVNGANKVFTLANTPDPITSLKLIINGRYYAPGGVDYVLSGLTITLDSDVDAPIAGSIIRAWYRYK